MHFSCVLGRVAWRGMARRQNKTGRCATCRVHLRSGEQFPPSSHPDAVRAGRKAGSYTVVSLVFLHLRADPRRTFVLSPRTTTRAIPGSSVEAQRCLAEPGTRSSVPTEAQIPTRMPREYEEGEKPVRRGRYNEEMMTIKRDGE